MKKWNGNSFSKTKLATAVAVVSLGLLAGGCGSDGDRSTSVGDSGSVTQINRAEGTVTGHVQDTNGNPVAGATVFIAGQSATTDGGGNYLFDSVQVLNSTGTDDNAGGAIANALQVVISVPGYIGATVTVTPLAQVDANDSGNGNASTDVNAANMFLDGFLAPAGTAVLPKLGASVTGNLRDGRTGEALVGQTIALDFSGVLNALTVQQQAINGVAVSYAVPETYYATTGTNGLFSIANLPSDSSFNLAVQSSFVTAGVGYTVTGITNPGDTVANLGGAANTNAMLVGTNNEGISQVLGTVTVLPIVSTDAIAPVVSSVSTVKNPYDVTVRAPDPSVTGQVAARPAGALDDNEVSSITVNFSEVLAPTEVNENSVVIWNSTVGRYETGFTVAMSSDNKSLTITFASAYDTVTANFLEVNLLQDDFMDGSNNLLTEGSTFLPTANAPAGTGGNTLNDIAFDNLNAPTGKTSFLRLDLCTFLQPPQGASQVTPTQLKVPAATTPGATGFAEVAAMQTYSGAFNDVEDSRNTFGDGVFVDQLNVAEAETRLEALATALTGGAVAINNDRALITFAAPAAGAGDVAAAYRITATATAGGAAIPVTLATAGVTDTDASANIVSVSVAAGTVVEVLVGAGAIAGQSVVTVTPLDGFGNSEGSTSLVLVDNVEPTVILQSAHGLAGTTGSGIVNPFGDGAEISDGGSAAALSPAWRVNGGHFTESRTTLTPLSQQLEDAANAAMVDGGISAANTGGDAITQVYDATAWNAREGSQSFQSAIAMSESLTSATLAYSGTANLTGVTVDNDITRSVWVENGNLQTIPGDIVRFLVSDIEVMAADAGATINMVGSVDLVGNVAAATASATVVDNLPPLVESAIYTSSGITVVFNESIQIPTTASSLLIDLDGTTQTVFLNAAAGGVNPANCAGVTVSGATLTIAQCYAIANGFAYQDAFDISTSTTGPLGNYAETDANYGTINNSTPRHTSLVWSTVQDLAGNSWATTLPTDTADPNPNYAGCVAAGVPAAVGCLKWTGLGRDGGGVGAGQSPVFAMIDGLGPFNILQANGAFTTTTGNPPVATNTGSFTLTFSHPFYVNENDTTLSDGVTANTRLAISGNANAVTPTAAATTITQADCSNFFQYVSADANTDFLGGAGANASTCTVTFAETGTATSDATGTSAQMTINIIKSNGAAVNIAIADEVRVRPAGGAAPADPLGYVFQSSLTQEVDTIAVSPAN